ncbi:hypothetical protein [Companilactobacillus metriopterae]|uniref:hypothetical protein n=1 Tax=Companilactobacillus metriopterae TaxID=1909267 RepID=UPI00100A24B6|nr:hypothetical protein [Companilactobacillus metriopterae]
MLAAPYSTKVRSYFKNMPGNYHTCNIKQEVKSQEIVNHDQNKIYNSGEAVLSFFEDSLEEKTEKENLSKNDASAEIGMSKRNHKDKKTNKETVTRQKKIKTIVEVVKNRYTKQLLEDGTLFELNDLFHELKNSKKKYKLPDPRLKNIWYGKIQIYREKKINKKDNDEYYYKLFVVNQTINNRNISIFMNANQIGELLPNFQNYISTGYKNNPKKVQYTLNLYTTEKPVTVKNRYENIKLKNEWSHLNLFFYIEVP